jgi:hypothetical protein
MSRYKPDPDMINKERYKDVSTGIVRKLVDDYFAENTADSKFMIEKAGIEDAKREIRMIMWGEIRTYLR